MEMREWREIVDFQLSKTMYFGFIATLYFIFLQIFDSSTKLGEIALERNASKLRLGQRNVCPHEELQIQTVRRPCMRALTRYVRTRKARNCHFGTNSAGCAVRVPNQESISYPINFT
uniref:Uncharacterized protein n=1 Tax=Meloidogyne incognita TaxID=6306 RepID=A0A914LPE7_MELIC